MARRARFGVAATLGFALAIGAPAWASHDPSEPSIRTPRPPRTISPDDDVVPTDPPVATSRARPPARRRSDPGGSTAERPSERRATAVVTTGPATARAIALTLDDGYRADPRILDLMQEYGIRGTAFLVGKVAVANPWLVSRLVELEWEVCSHTWSHRRLTGLSEPAMREEIERGADAVAGLAGTSCPYLRPPEGAVNATVVRVARELGFTVVNWNASISDSTSVSTPTSLQVKIAMSGIRPGAILLGHFGGAHSYVVLREVLDRVVGDGYTVGTVTQLLNGGTTKSRSGVDVLIGLGPERLVLLADRRPVMDRFVDLAPRGAWTGLALIVAGLALWGASRTAAARRPIAPAFELAAVPDERAPAVAVADA